MQIFSCDNCGHPVFFENVQCLHCGSTLAFLPDRMTLAAIELVPGEVPPDTPALWQRQTPDDPPVQYRLCQNQVQHQACNFTVRAEDGNPLCVSCRQTRILPDLSTPQNHERWYRIEVAKRMLFYTLARLGLADPCGGDAVQSPRYEFLADLPGGPKVMTGHNEGLITLNVAEADDDERARRRVELFEPYRTLLGHMRHESGHFYWDRLIRNGPKLAECRALFGDESVDYMQSLQAHYAAGVRTDWQDNFVSAYAAAHPWEDWAETWAHYLHMVDLLETAASYRTRIVVPSADGGEQRSRAADPFGPNDDDFDNWIAQWVPVTLLVNSLNRSLGQNDAYPFALSEKALSKLRFVHEVIHASAAPPDFGCSGAYIAPAPAADTGTDAKPDAAPQDGSPSLQPSATHAPVSSASLAIEKPA